jgi:hypothetical protein
LGFLLLGVLLFNLPSTLQTFVPAWGGASIAEDYNFYEHYDSPIVVSLGKIPLASTETPKLRLLDSTGLFAANYKINNLHITQPSLGSYQSIEVQGFGEWKCVCSMGELVVLLPLEGKNLVPSSDPRFQNLVILKERCLAELKKAHCNIQVLNEGMWAARLAENRPDIE